MDQKYLDKKVDFLNLGKKYNRDFELAESIIKLSESLEASVFSNLARFYTSNILWYRNWILFRETQQLITD